MVLTINLSEVNYDIVIERNLLYKLNEYLNLDRKVLIITDEGIPAEYVNLVKNQCTSSYLFTVKQGESSKSFKVYEEILMYLANKNFTRTDCIIALGGGVVGDLSGFIASTYMRGLDFYNIPTTLLSQVDSSIGGKTAINLNGIKNIVGSFYQPKKVIIDPNTLKTLDQRLFSEGLAEIIKMAMTSNEKLFDFIESGIHSEADIDKLIIESLKIKKEIVEKDPTEYSIRKILNFGHTIGHAIETLSNGKLYHGECVAIGMTYMCSSKVKARLLPLLKKYDLLIDNPFNSNELMRIIAHDKKMSNKQITIIYVEEIGTYSMKKIEYEEVLNFIKGGN